MTKKELGLIKQDLEEAETTFFAGSGNQLIDYVAKQVLFMVVRIQKIAKIRIGNRIRKIHRVSVSNDIVDLSTKVNTSCRILKPCI